jgi:hypothetical protein
MHTETTLPAVQFDGDDSATQLIRGAILKCVDANWSAKNNAILHPEHQYYCLGTTQALQCRRDGMLSDTIMKVPGAALPNVDELNAKILQSSWEKGLDGKPRPPWQHMWVAYLVRVSDAAAFTYLNSTWGARIAVGQLTDQVKHMCALRGVNVVPVVKLSSAPMATNFGQKMRPHFEIVDWRELSSGQPVQIEAKAVGKPAPVTTTEELDDSIPF